MKKDLNPLNHWYEGEENISINAREYGLLKTALEQAMALVIETTYPEITGFVDKTGAVVEKPTQKQFENEEVQQVVMPDKTFSAANRKVHYKSTVTNELIAANELILSIHMRNIEAGNTKTLEELQKIYETKKASKLEVV